MKSFQVLFLMLTVFGYAAIAFAEPLTVADAIQTTRFMKGVPTFSTVTASGEILSFGSSEILVSPDSKQWVALLVRGDLERNGNWAEILLGNMGSLDAAAHPRILARFFTHSLGGDAKGGPVDLTLSSSKNLRWISNSRLALLWTDTSDRTQIFVVDISSGKVQQLSRHPTSLLAFENHGDKFLYLADYRAKDSSAAISTKANGVTVEARNLWAVLRGQFDEDSDGLFLCEWFILDANTGESRAITGLGVNRFDWKGASFSGDGRFAIIESSPKSVPESWDRYTERFLSQWIPRARSNRNDAQGQQLLQLYVVDMRQSTAWPLWDAPGKVGAKIAWSPDGQAVALSPTVVPVSGADAAGLAGDATAVVDIKSGRFRAIPISTRSPLAAATLKWVDSTTIELQDGNEVHRYRGRDGNWNRVSPRSRSTQPSSLEHVAVDVRIEEDLNTPPVVVAIERASGRRRLIFDPNPQLRSRFTLGRIEMIDWRDSEGRVWNGRLDYPVNWQAGRRYPLVIQTAGYASSKHDQKFSLYGSEVGPGLGPGTTVHAAQPLASRGIMVLSAERKYLPEIENTPRRAPMHASAYEAAIGHLDRIGLIDSKRVGISGFSNTGYLVQYALVHSAFHYAAAITDDNIDGSYYQAVTMGLKGHAALNGAEPYGEGLKLWLQRAPGFNVDKVRTPLRLQVTSPPPVSILGAWEMFTRLRDLNKPVELFLMPEIDRGSHGIQNPAQCLASQQGTVDWFDFWLNGHEDGMAEKADQYARWRKLRTQHEVALQQQRPPARGPVG